MATTVRVLVEHALPHRVRLRVPALAERRDACGRVAAALAASAGPLRVTARPATGSLIVDDTSRALDPRDLAARLEAVVRAERDEEGRPLADAEIGEHPGPTRVARAVVHAVAGINADVRAALDDRADLGTLLPVFFATAGIAEAAATTHLPVPTWFNLLWWSLRSFMTFNIRAMEEGVSNGQTPRPHDIARAL